MSREVDAVKEAIDRLAATPSDRLDMTIRLYNPFQSVENMTQLLNCIHGTSTKPYAAASSHRPNEAPKNVDENRKRAERHFLMKLSLLSR
jgi:hypothetical protein